MTGQRKSVLSFPRAANCGKVNIWVGTNGVKFFADFCGAISGLIRVSLQCKENLYPALRQKMGSFFWICCFLIPSAQNNLFVREAYLGVTYSSLLQRFCKYFKDIVTFTVSENRNWFNMLEGHLTLFIRIYLMHPLSWVIQLQWICQIILPKYFHSDTKMYI